MIITELNIFFALYISLLATWRIKRKRKGVSWIQVDKSRLTNPNIFNYNGMQAFPGKNKAGGTVPRKMNGKIKT